MAWQKLKENYTDAKWTGKRKYRKIDNSDGTVSFDDVTAYTDKETSFYRASDANSTNKAINLLMGMTENGTNLYDDFQRYFETQKTRWTETFQGSKNELELAFNQWFEEKKETLNSTAVGTLDNKIDTVESKLNNKIEKESLFKLNGLTHNSIFRGKNLGGFVSNAQLQNIKNGTFEDLYVGDYWDINGVKYRIAGFNYYLNVGATPLKTPHAVIIPDKCLRTEKMNLTATTNGGYASSNLKTTQHPNLLSTLKAALGDNNLANFSIYISTTASNGVVTAGSWLKTQVTIPTEIMVYGTTIFGKATDDGLATVETSQLPLFRLAPELIKATDSHYWLRDVANGTNFSVVYQSGLAYRWQANYATGIRPVCCLG